jgi:hypothetical protein
MATTTPTERCMTHFIVLRTAGKTMIRCEHNGCQCLIGKHETACLCHSCMHSGCSKTAMAGSEFCKHHRCPRCKGEKSSGSYLCATCNDADTHECERENCRNRITHSRRWCDTHTCPGCSGLKSSKAIICGNPDCMMAGIGVKVCEAIAYERR